MEFLQQFFSSNGFQPHAYCFVWRRELLWFFIVSDVIIAASYYSIPAVLTSFVRQREDLAYKWVFLLFGAFIFSCGTTHIMDVIVLWQPYYWLQGYIKFITALISAATAILLWPLLPKALALRSPTELEVINQRLQQEITERQVTAIDLQMSRNDLEVRVMERTAELRAVNEKPAQTEAKYRNIFENANEGIFQSTASGRIITANPALIKMFGYPSESVFLEDLQVQNNYLDPTRRAEFIQQIDCYGVVMDFESQVYHREGHTFWIAENARAIKDTEGNILYYEGSIQNITDRKQSEAQRLALEASELKMLELEKLNLLKDDFLSSVSHELRTPMTNIRMAITLLKTASSPEKQARYLQALEVQCDREIDLINDLLSLQRLETSTMNPILEIVSLKEWLTELVDAFADRAEQQEQHMTLEMGPVDRLCTDISMLGRILSELLNNACKYTPKGGFIQIQVREQDADHIEFKLANTSLDISSEELPQIFEKFYRVQRKDLWSQGGTGLGLALVKKLVERLNGTIHVASEQGVVSFTLILPNQERELCLEMG